MGIEIPASSNRTHLDRLAYIKTNCMYPSLCCSMDCAGSYRQPWSPHKLAVCFVSFCSYEMVLRKLFETFSWTTVYIIDFGGRGLFQYCEELFRSLKRTPGILPIFKSLRWTTNVNYTYVLEDFRKSSRGTGRKADTVAGDFGSFVLQASAFFIVVLLFGHAPKIRRFMVGFDTILKPKTSYVLNFQVEAAKADMTNGEFVRKSIGPSTGVVSSAVASVFLPEAVKLFRNFV